MEKPSAQVVRLYNVYTDQVLNTFDRSYHTDKALSTALVYHVAMLRMGIDPRSPEQQKARALLDVLGTWQHQVPKGKKK